MINAKARVLRQVVRVIPGLYDVAESRRRADSPQLMGTTYEYWWRGLPVAPPAESSTNLRPQARPS